MSTVGTEEAVRVLEHGAMQMLEDARKPGLHPDKSLFLNSWGRLLTEMAEWIFMQTIASLLSEEDILKIAEFHLDVASSYKQERTTSLVPSSA